MGTVGKLAVAEGSIGNGSFGIAGGLGKWKMRHESGVLDKKRWREAAVRALLRTHEADLVECERRAGGVEKRFSRLHGESGCGCDLSAGNEGASGRRAACGLGGWIHAALVFGGE